MSRKDANSQPLLKEQQHEGECAHAGAFRRLAPSFPAWPQPAGTERRPSVPCLLVRSASVAPEWALGLPSRGPSPETSPLLCKGASPWAPRGAVSPESVSNHGATQTDHCISCRFFFFWFQKQHTYYGIWEDATATPLPRTLQLIEVFSITSSFVCNIKTR